MFDKAKLLEVSTIMLPHTITLFTMYANVNENSEAFQEYKGYDVPTIINNVAYEKSKNYQTSQGAVEVGDYSLWISLNMSRFTRYIYDEEFGWIQKEVEYIDYAEYVNKGFDEQAERYFTIYPQKSKFILGRLYKYEQTLKIPDKELNSNSLLKEGKIYHSISSIDVNGLDSQKPYGLYITGKL